MSQDRSDSPEITPLYPLEDHGEFIMRHIGPRDEQVRDMLSAIGLDSLE